MTMKGGEIKPNPEPIKPSEPVLVEASKEDLEALGQITIQEALDKAGYIPDNPAKQTFIKPAKESVLAKMTLTREDMLARIDLSTKIL